VKFLVQENWQNSDFWETVAEVDTYAEAERRLKAVPKRADGRIWVDPEDAEEIREALVGLISNIRAHRLGECPGIVAADCLDAIYEATEWAAKAVPSESEETKG
jgi:hypothetical protein